MKRPTQVQSQEKTNLYIVNRKIKPISSINGVVQNVMTQRELWTDNVEPRKEEKLYKYVSEIELSKVAEDTVSYGERK